jgi:WD40 repeat protein
MSQAKDVTSFRVPGSSFSGVLMFTPDGRSVITCTNDSILRFWNAHTGEAIGTVECPDRVGRIAIDSSGTRLAVAFWDATVLIYDLRSVLKVPKDS